MKLCFLGDARNSHVQKWVSFFAERVHEVHLITFRPFRMAGVVQHAIPRVFPVRISPVASTFGKLGYLWYLTGVRKMIHRIAPDILHAHWATSYGLLGACAGYHPFVLSTWGSDIFDFPLKSYWHKRMITFILNRADHLTATSRMLTAETRRYLRGDQEILTVPFGVDIDAFRPGETNDRRGITVGIVKRLEEKYGIEYLIRAFALISPDHPNVKLLLVGEGSLQASLQRLCRELKVDDKVRFAGFIEHDRVPEYLRQMDIFVVPSIRSSETFGVAAVEASASQLPVIASNIGGLPEVIVEGETGFLVPPRDPRAIASKLTLLIQNEGLRRTMGRAGRAFVQKRYVWKENAGKMEELYSRILGR